MIGVVAGQEVGGVSCAYPLDDDGSLVSAFGYGYAGPATGADLQTLSYTTTGLGGVKVLLAANSLTTANFPRRAETQAFEASVISKGGATGCGMAIALVDSSGALYNAVTLNAAADGDTLSFEVAPDGVVTATRNGTPIGISGNWLAPAGQKTVGPTDRFAPYLWLTDSTTGEPVEITLRTNSPDMTGTYLTGTTDICGNPL